VLLFWNPACRYCQQILPRLRAWEDEKPDAAPALLFVSTGSVEANEAMGVRSTIVLDYFRTPRALGARGTPAAVVLDADGNVGSELAAGAHAVLALTERTGAPRGRTH
jgi:hypothetical protein